MAVSEARRRSILASLFLATLVFAAFFTFRSYGPESAIRRFHQAVARGDASGLRDSVVQAPEAFSVYVLAGRVQEYLAAGSTIRIARMDRSADQVRAAVAYETPEGTGGAMIWVVTRQPDGWRVDADKTLTIIRDAMGL